MEVIDMLNDILKNKNIDEVYEAMVVNNPSLTIQEFTNIILKRESPTVKFIIDYAETLGCRVNLSIDCSAVTPQKKTMKIVNKVLKKLKFK